MNCILKEKVVDFSACLQKISSFSLSTLLPITISLLYLKDLSPCHGFLKFEDDLDIFLVQICSFSPPPNFSGEDDPFKCQAFNVVILSSIGLKQLQASTLSFLILSSTLQVFPSHQWDLELF